MWIIFFTLYVQLSCQLPDNEHNHQILNSHTNFDNLDDRYIFLVGQMTLLHEKMDKMIVEIQTLKETLANEQTQTTTPMRLVDKRPMSRPSTVRPPRRTPTPTRARSAAELAVERQQFKSMLMSLEKLPLVVEKLLLTNLTSVSSRVIQHATKFRFKPPLAVVGERRSEQVLDGREIEAISIRGIMHSGTRWLRQSINAHFSKRLRYAGFKFTSRDHSEQVVCDADGLYGWKHGLIDRRQLQQLEENNHVLIVTFLHLWPFLFRQRRQPYLKKTQLKPNAPLSQFMRYKPTTETFDDDFKFPFVPYTYKNYVQMRSAKYRNFLWAMSQSSDEDGVLQISHGSYGSEAFARASWQKSLFVVAALRLGYNVLLVDIDILYNKPLPISQFSQSLTESNKPNLIMQQDPRDHCMLEVNTGFYAARASSWTARFISRAIFLAKSRKETEQRAWVSLLETMYGNALIANCNNNPLHFENKDRNSDIHLLPVAKYMNGFWMNKTSETLNSIIIHFNWIVGNCNKLAAMKNFVS